MFYWSIVEHLKELTRLIEIKLFHNLSTQSIYIQIQIK